MAVVLLAWLATLPAIAVAHDIPNARVDRAIQVVLAPGTLRVDYEVSLAELTLVQDLRGLIGPQPGVDRAALFDRYGREVGPLNARGILASMDGRPIDLEPAGFDLAVEEHPRYTFHFRAELPDRGRLALVDTNYVASEGTSRLALRAAPGVVGSGYDGPARVADVPIRPVWQMSDAEERRTKEVEVNFGPASGLASDSIAPEVAPDDAAVVTAIEPQRSQSPTTGRLAGLLDRAAEISWPLLGTIALLLGAAHAIQPGHGKTLVAAASLSGRGGWYRGPLLAIVTTIAHAGSVLAIAGVLWATRTGRYADINTLLARIAGFVIAAVGFWRLGRHLGGFPEHDPGPVSDEGRRLDDHRSLIGLGLAGGLVPCWDAIVLIILAEAVGRLALGIWLLAAFSLGMGSVLVVVGLIAGRVRGAISRFDRGGGFVRGLGFAGALLLAAIGLYLMSGAGLGS